MRSKFETVQSRKCVICFCIFSSDSDLRSHLLEKHEFKEYFNSNEQAKDAELLVNNSIVIYYCDKCDFQYDEADAVEAHKEIYHENNCDNCDEKFEDEDALNSHIELHHVNKCDKCDYTSTTSQT